MVSPEGVEYQALEDETAQILLSGTSGKAKPAGALFKRGTSAYASRFFSATADSLREKRERRLVKPGRNRTLSSPFRSPLDGA